VERTGVREIAIGPLGPLEGRLQDLAGRANLLRGEGGDAPRLGVAHVGLGGADERIGRIQLLEQVGLGQIMQHLPRGDIVVQFRLEETLVQDLAPQLRIVALDLGAAKERAHIEEIAFAGLFRRGGHDLAGGVEIAGVELELVRALADGPTEVAGRFLVVVAGQRRLAGPDESRRVLTVLLHGDEGHDAGRDGRAGEDDDQEFLVDARCHCWKPQVPRSVRGEGSRLVRGSGSGGGGALGGRLA
jgi:hypothetical protein